MGTTRPGYMAVNWNDHADVADATGVTGSSDAAGSGDADETCAATVDWCHCTLPAHLDGPHVCDCGGSWEWTETGRFIVHAWPR